MGRLKTISLCATLILPTLPQALAARGLPETRQDQLYFFATCSGRLSALMEHQWLLDGPASEDTARTRAEMLSLLQAVTPPDQAATVMQWRISAKVAQASLLSQASFDLDPARAAWAKRRAEGLTAACIAALLG